MQGLKQTIEFAPGKEITLETGRLAKQADGAIVARMGDTMVLCTAVISRDVRPGQDFFPLTVDYREKFSAGGKIPGGFIKREGRPTDKEVLSSRLIDRCIRPNFPDGFINEVQIIASVISADEDYDADVIAGTAASAALILTGAPFDGPLGEVRIGRVDGEYIVNPTLTDLESSDFNLVVAGKEDAIVMVEGEMDEVTEEEIVEALDIAHAAIRKLIAGQLALKEQVNPAPLEYTTTTVPAELVKKVHAMIAEPMAAHIRAPYEKQSFYQGISEFKTGVVEALLGKDDEESGESQAETTEEGWTKGEIKGAVGIVEKKIMRGMIVKEGRRLDGRGLTDVRDIWCETSYLPRVHGSSIFTRGETQVMASVTLGTTKDVQPVDQIFDNEDKSFYLHYSFPPFSVGEARFLRGPGRREIGHGMLAERALKPMLPPSESFPYSIRINADVLESNGSSSMASVCSGSLALMDAGVPIKKAVAGVAMGLIEEEGATAVLTDILGTEDHLGDMDFKITGTRDGVTACQMDIKISGLSRDLMLKALNQAYDARQHILDVMDDTLDAPRGDLSAFAPRLTQITIDADFIGAVIGPGGKIIKGIQADTNTQVDIEEKDGFGFITVASNNQENAMAAIEMIRNIVAVPEPGETYEGTVRSIKDFGAIIEILGGKEGLLHVSELDHGYVEKVTDYVQVGDKIQVQLLELRDGNKLRFSRKALLPKPEGSDNRSDRPRRDDRRGGGSRDGGRDGNRGGRRGGRGSRDGGRDGNRGRRD